MSVVASVDTEFIKRKLELMNKLVDEIIYELDWLYRLETPLGGYELLRLESLVEQFYNEYGELVRYLAGLDVGGDAFLLGFLDSVRRDVENLRREVDTRLAEFGALLFSL